MSWKLYEQLGVSKGASKEEIKKAYKKKALETHPDRGGDPELFKQINNAYTILNEDSTRDRYDQLGDDRFEENSGGGGPAMNPHDIFQQFFGQGFNFNFQNGNGNGFHQEQETKRATHKHIFKIDMKDAFFGAKKGIRIVLHKTCLKCTDRCFACQGRGQITEMHRMGFFTQMITHPCGQCSGSGTVSKGKHGCSECKGAGKYNQEKIVELDIPSGIDTGHVIVFEEMGEQPTRSGEIAGDLHIEIFVHPHEKLTRQGNDLYIRVPVSFKDSVVGTKIELPYFTGAVAVDTLELGILQPTKHYVIKGKGMPVRGRNDYANMIVQFDIQYPNVKITQDNSKKISELFDSVGI